MGMCTALTRIENADLTGLILVRGLWGRSVASLAAGVVLGWAASLVVFGIKGVLGDSVSLIKEGLAVFLLFGVYN